MQIFVKKIKLPTVVFKNYNNKISKTDEKK